MPLNKQETITAGRPEFGAPALRSLLQQQGAQAAWQQAFSSAGTAAPAQVAGSFAVGLKLDDGRTFLAVDRFAIEPMCYRVVNGELRFAQRADALVGALIGALADPSNGASVDIDPQAIYDYLYVHVIPSPRTIFKGVFRLPAGHCAVFHNGQLTVAPYWVPEFQPASAGSVSFNTLKTEFRSTLQDAVARQLDGGKPGCFLSGGTDSSTVAGMVGLAAGRPAATYSIGFEAAGYDEMAFARIASKAFGTAHHEYYVTPDDLVRSIADVAAHYDLPFGNSSAVPAYYCAKMAREDGITRILAGDGGDELFGGNSRYAKQKVFGLYDSVPGPVKALLEPLFGLGIVASTPGLGKVSSYIKQANVPMPDRQHTYNQLERLGVQDVLTPAFLQQVSTTGPHEHQRGVWGLAKARNLLDKQLAYDWRYTLAENDLPKVCGTTALAGVEVGFPMLDSALVDFSMRLPTSYKLKGLKLRWFFKEALRDFLPDEIITKKKQGFGLPFGVWAHRHAALNALATDSLHSLATRGFVRPEFIKTLLQERLAQHPGYYGEMIWILMMLEQWLRKHAPGYGMKG